LVSFCNSTQSHNPEELGVKAEKC